MVTGLIFILIGLIILFYPQILIIMIASLFILFGFGLMAMSWQFRRLRKQAQSRFVNWLIRW